MVLDTSLLNTKHYKVRIKNKKAIQGTQQHSTLHFREVAIEKVLHIDLRPGRTVKEEMHLCK